MTVPSLRKFSNMLLLLYTSFTWHVFLSPSPLPLQQTPRFCAMIFLLFFNSVFYFVVENTKFLAEQEHPWKTFLSSHSSCTLDSCWHVYLVKPKYLPIWCNGPIPTVEIKKNALGYATSPREDSWCLYMTSPAARGILCTASKSDMDHSHITSITTFNTWENTIPHQLRSQLSVPDYASFQPS